MTVSEQRTKRNKSESSCVFLHFPGLHISVIGGVS